MQGTKQRFWPTHCTSNCYLHTWRVFGSPRQWTSYQGSMPNSLSRRMWSLSTQLSDMGLSQWLGTTKSLINSWYVLFLSLLSFCVSNFYFIFLNFINNGWCYLLVISYYHSHLLCALLKAYRNLCTFCYLFHFSFLAFCFYVLQFSWSSKKSIQRKFTLNDISPTLYVCMDFWWLNCEVWCTDKYDWSNLFAWGMVNWQWQEGPHLCLYNYIQILKKVGRGFFSFSFWLACNLKWTVQLFLVAIIFWWYQMVW